MKIVSNFKQLEHTEALDQKIHEKTSKLRKYMDGNFEVHWTCSVRDDGAQCADIKLIGPSFEYHASAHSDSLYKTLDLSISKIEKQIQKKKSKWKDHITRKHKNTIKDQQVADGIWDENYWQDKDEDLAS